MLNKNCKVCSLFLKTFNSIQLRSLPFLESCPTCVRCRSVQPCMYGCASTEMPQHFGFFFLCVVCLQNFHTRRIHIMYVGMESLCSGMNHTGFVTKLHDCCFFCTRQNAVHNPSPCLFLAPSFFSTHHFDVVSSKSPYPHPFPSLSNP